MKTAFRSAQVTKLIAIGLVIVIGGFTGLRLTGYSLAYASNNPYGYVDSCALVNNVTTIYGWANDPNAPLGPYPYATINIGTTSLTVTTNVSGYRDKQINAYIQQYYPDQPLSGEYGFVAQFSGLYKGTNYSISGTAVNYGVGANAGLTINNTHNIDGDTTKPYFANNLIPSACLAQAPTPSSPTPAPPSSSPTPTSPSSSSSRPSTSTSTSHTQTPAAATLSSAADGVAAVGTHSAAIKVPAGNASSIRLTYTSPYGITTTTPDQTVNANDVTIVLNGLEPKTTYSYTIIRTSPTTSVTSTSSTFTTSGYSLSILFMTSTGKPVTGISGSINDDSNSRAISDKNGTMSFANLASGVYVVHYVYALKAYNATIDTSSSKFGNDADNAQHIIQLRDTINVDKLASNPVPTPRKTNRQYLIVIGVVVAILLIGLLWFVWRKRRHSRAFQHDVPIGPAVPDILDRKSHLSFAKRQPPPPPPEHMGQSLRDMVIRSMHDEAIRRRQEPPENPQS